MAKKEDNLSKTLHLHPNHAGNIRSNRNLAYKVLRLEPGGTFTAVDPLSR